MAEPSLPELSEEPTAALAADTAACRVVLLLAITSTTPPLSRPVVERFAWSWLPGLEPMLLRARATPMPSWSAPLPPFEAVPVTLSTLAVKVVVSLASTPIAPVNGVLFRPLIEAPLTWATVLPVWVLVLLAPPPIKPTTRLSPSLVAMSIVTAVASLTTVAWRLPLTSRLPPRLRLARSLMDAVRSPLIVLLARETPTSTERLVPLASTPAWVIASDPDPAPAWMARPSLASTLRSPESDRLPGLVWPPGPAMLAVTSPCRLLLTEAPPPSRALDPPWPAERASAREALAATALI